MDPAPANGIDHIHAARLEGIEVRTADLVCTVDGGDSLLAGQYWRLIGRLIPGAVDHVAVYIGPGGRCVEAGGAGRVIAFEFEDGAWDAEAMYGRRRMLDRLYGVADPLAGRGLGAERESCIRLSVAAYCLEQARLEKPYNLDFLDSATEEAFYCSQLAYRAYLREGIDLNSGEGVPDIPGTRSIIFPQELWGCAGRRTRAT